MTPPVIRKLDFSGFHPLDHYLWECRGYPGGRRTHLRYRWDFQWKDRLRKLTLCRLGLHKRVPWWHLATETTGFSCLSCDKDLS